MMKKLITLCISVLVTIAGTVFLGLYDKNIYYSPDGKNASAIQSEYTDYITKNFLEITGDDEKQTVDRINLLRIKTNQYYSEEPMFKKDIMNGDNKLFTIAVYKNVIRYTPDADTSLLKYRYEMVIYNVNYVEIQKLFLNQSVPEDKTIITKAEYPDLIINFYPNDEYNDDEALFYDESDNKYKTTLYNGDSLYGSSLNGYTSLNLYDYMSNPQMNEDKEPYFVKYLLFNGYPTVCERLGLFDGDAYVKVDAVLTSEEKYTLEDSLVKEKIEGFNFSDEIKVEDYKKGANQSSSVLEVLNNTGEILGLQNYSTWLFWHYIWWQCLICFVILGGVMTGFYFTVTYEDTSKGKKKPNKK